MQKEHFAFAYADKPHDEPQWVGVVAQTGATIVFLGTVWVFMTLFFG
jgi:hypothetical protein